MQAVRFLKTSAIVLAMFGMMLSPTHLMAAGPVQTPNPGKATPPAVIDLALSTNGALTGQVIDAQGNARTKAEVTLLRGSQTIRATLSNEVGEFSIADVQPGVYRVVAEKGEGIFRIWAPKTAPPSAKQKILLVAGYRIIRGQSGQLQGVYGGEAGRLRLTDNPLQLNEDTEVSYGGYSFSPAEPAAAPSLIGGMDIFTTTTILSSVGAIVVSAISIDKLNDVENKLDEKVKTP